MSTNTAGMILIEQLVAEDLDKGIGRVRRSKPSGGEQWGQQINLASALGEYKVAQWTPNSIQLQSNDITTLQVDGAKVGDAVIVTFDSITFAQHRDLSIEAKVSSPNTVTIIMINRSTSQQLNPGTGALRVVVLALPVAEFD